MQSRRLLSSQVLRELPSISAAVSEGRAGDLVRINGWITALQKFKGLKFLHVGDGLSGDKLQVVLPKELRDLSGVSHGAAVTVEGSLVPSQGGQQSLELLASFVRPHNPTLPGPIMPRTKYSSPFLRRYAHLRPKTASFGALLRTRNELTMAIHRFFQDEDFVNISTPAITGNDCEGAGETFRVTSRTKPGVDLSPEAVETEERMSEAEEEQAALEDGRRPQSASEFFGQAAFLTTSGQLHLEAASQGLRRVYALAPAFRAEATLRRFHMAEFSMLEAELAFTDHLDPLLLIVEKLMKQTACLLLDKCEKDLQILDRFHHDGKMAYLESFNGALQEPFPRITFEGARTLLNNQRSKYNFQFEVVDDLKKEHEWAIVEHFGGRPVFVTHFPAHAKPFYAKRSPCGQWAESFDLLSPVVGEICSGSLREDSAAALRERCEELGNLDQLRWYVDLRESGYAATGGFGIGVERWAQTMLGIFNAKDCLPFPRWYQRCQL